MYIFLFSFSVIQLFLQLFLSFVFLSGASMRLTKLLLFICQNYFLIVIKINFFDFFCFLIANAYSLGNVNKTKSSD